MTTRLVHQILNYRITHRQRHSTDLPKLGDIILETESEDSLGVKRWNMRIKVEVGGKNVADDPDIILLELLLDKAGVEL